MSLKLVDNKVPTKEEKQYARYLHGLVDEIFHISSDEMGWSWVDLAEQAGLSYTTVNRLGNRVTQYPRHMTVWKLAKALGMEHLCVNQKMFNKRRKAG